MSENNAILVENISKLYRLGMERQSSDNLSTAMASFFRSPLSNYRKYRSLYDFRDVDTANREGATDSNAREDILWALNDVSFEVPRVKYSASLGKTALVSRHC